MMNKKILVPILSCLILTSCGDRAASSAQSQPSDSPAVIEASQEGAADEPETHETEAADMADPGAADVPETPETPPASTVTIYDIDFGNMEVPFDPSLPQTPYDWSLLEKQGDRLSYADGTYASRFGVDVSKFQGEIDWEKAAADGVDFAIVRIGNRGYGDSGVLMEDPCAEANIKGALSHGIGVGTYFFSQAKTNEEAREEAEFTLSLLEKYGVTPNDLAYPVMVDSERIKSEDLTVSEDQGRTRGLTNTEKTDTALIYCERILEAGFGTGIYANSLWFTTRLQLDRIMNHVGDIAIWYADYEIIDHGNPPLYPYDFSIWQYTEKGRVDGIEGEVDLNISFEK